LAAVAQRGADGGGLAVIDRDGTMPGRGAYLCRGMSADAPRADCVRLAARRGAVARALRAPVELHHEIVESVSP
jgi:predicted RNA-binding protein YlxR (DUF448 family)